MKIRMKINPISTATMRNELLKTKSIRDFLARYKKYMLDLTLSEYLTLLLQQKELTRADVVRDSGLEKAYVYQIFDGKKRPSREKLIPIAFGLHLNVEETQRMLKLGSCSELYARQSRDAIILFAIKQGMDITATDDLLYNNDLPTLLGRDK